MERKNVTHKGENRKAIKEKIGNQFVTVPCSVRRANKDDIGPFYSVDL
jgi:hypothetical protein